MLRIHTQHYNICSSFPEVPCRAALPLLEREGDAAAISSSNYTLYATMSDRVMRMLSQFSPALEVYSIDEAFEDLTPLSIDDLTEYGKTMRERVLQYTGLTVSVGIASTKCLCKIANEIVKHDPSCGCVLDLPALSDEEVDTLLSQVAIQDVWGIGRKYAGFLQKHGIMTAKDLKYADEQWIRKYLTVTGHRIVLEPRGISCIPLEIVRPTKKGIMCAKPLDRDKRLYRACRSRCLLRCPRSREIAEPGFTSSIADGLSQNKSFEQVYPSLRELSHHSSSLPNFVYP